MLLLLALCRTAAAAELVGSIVPPYPPGTATRNAACIGRQLDPPGNSGCRFTVGILETAGTYTWVYAARLDHYSGKKAFFRVTDAIPYPAVPQGYYLAFGLCRVNGERDDTVIAVVRRSAEEWHGDAVWAQKVELPAGKWKVIAPGNIECLNEDGDS
ncbi:MAG TPA: hypothetical protein VF203_06410 [Burkholderiales bacterium]